MLGIFLTVLQIQYTQATLSDGLQTEAQPEEMTDEELIITDRVIVEGEKILSISESQSIKTPTPIIDVPQSLTIITAEEIAARGFNSVGQIIDYTPGVNTSQGEGHRDAVVFRGIRSTADFFTDGHRDDMQYYRALYNVQQIEILRGPNALLFGRGGTGGILNRVSKKPLLSQDLNQYSLHINSFGATGATLDLNRQLGEDKAFRLNVMAKSLANHRDFYEGERFGLNPTYRVLIGSDTTIDLSYEYLNHQRFIDRGIPTTSGRPAVALEDIVFADPKNNYHQFEAHIARFNIQHFFDDTLKGTFNAFYGDYDKLYANYYATDYDEGLDRVELDGYIDDTQRQSLMLSGYLVGEFDQNPIAQTVIVGAEYILTDSNQSRFNPLFSSSGRDREWFSVNRPINFSGGLGRNAAGDLFNVAFTEFGDDTRVDLEVVSLFAQDELHFGDHLDLVLGLRFDRFNIEVFDADPSQRDTRQRVDEVVTPRAGLIFKPRENVSMYVSYSESFLPRSGEQYASLEGANDRLAPDTYTNQEVGLKWDFSPRLSMTLAAFKNTQSSPQVADDDPQTLDIVDSDIEGFEFQVSGQFTNSLYLTTNYSYLDGEIVDRLGPTGRRLRELPKHMASLWAAYQVSEHWGFGLGVTYQGKSFADNSNSARLPAYVRSDLSVYRNISETLRLQLNLENALNQRYFPNAHSTHQLSVGAPRNLMMTLIGSF